MVHGPMQTFLRIISPLRMCILQVTPLFGDLGPPNPGTLEPNIPNPNPEAQNCQNTLHSMVFEP